MTRIAYIGGLGRTYDLATVRRAAEMLGAELVVAGGENQLGREDLERMLASCDVGVVPMADNSWVGVPNKVFDYAKAGLPIASSLGGETAALLKRYGCGATWRYGDAASLVEAVRIAVATPEGASRRMFEQEFDAAKIYDDYVQRVLS